MAIQGIHVSSEGRFVADLGIERIVVHDIVTMWTARTSLEKRGRIYMTYPQRMEVWNYYGGVVEREVTVELQAVGTDGRSRGLHVGASSAVKYQ